MSWDKLVALDLLLVLSFYAVLLVLYHGYKKQKIRQTLALLVTVYAILLGLEYVMVYKFYPLIGVQLYRHMTFTWNAYFWKAFLSLFRFSLYAMLYFVARLAWSYFIQLKRNELLVLNSQFTAHFMGNTLVRWYGYLRTTNEQLAERFMKFSALFQYNLDAYTNPALQTVLLEKEVEHLQYLLEEYAAWTGWSAKGVLAIQGNLSGFRIPAYTFISLFENMIKHGSLNDPHVKPRIRLITTVDGFVFETINSIRPHDEWNPSHGMGLKNLRHRLQLLLGNCFSLHYEKVDGQFHLTLTVTT